MTSQPAAVAEVSWDDMQEWRTDTAWGQGMLQARINRLLDDLDDYRARIARIEHHSFEWLNKPDEAGCEDDVQLYRDLGIIVLHLACGRTFPEVPGGHP